MSASPLVNEREVTPESDDDYLTAHGVEEMLRVAVAHVLCERSVNPLSAMAAFLERHEMPLEPVSSASSYSGRRPCS